MIDKMHQTQLLDKTSEVKNLELVAKRLKLNMLKTVQAAQTGHLGACCSSNELLTGLYFADGTMKIDADNPKHPDRDLVLLRGHLGPSRYNIFAMLGWMDESEMTKYRKFGSRLHGHEDMHKTPGVDLTPSGSLGMLLSYSVGARYSFANRGLDNKIFCFLGDGEEQEGNVSEAARHASHLGVKNLITIIDQNKKQLSTSSEKVDGKSDLSRIWSGYGWDIVKIDDGHDMSEVVDKYRLAIRKAMQGPVCIIANTVKGNGIKGAEENYCGFHVFHNTEEDDQKNRIDLESAITDLSSQLESQQIIIPRKRIVSGSGEKLEEKLDLPKIDPKVSDRQVTSYEYLNEFLSEMSSKLNGQNFYVLTADYPPRDLVYNEGKFSLPNLTYCNVGIREQHLLSMAHGIATVEKEAKILVLCGDAFVYRFADQMNVLAQSNDNVVIYSVQAGLSGAKNGSTHQSSGQSGVALTMPNMKFYEPSSKLDWFYLMNQAFSESGVKYVRTHKGLTPFDFGNFQPKAYYSTNFKDEDVDCTIVASGMPVNEAAIASRKIYDDSKIKARVVNVINPKELTGISRVVEQNKPLLIAYNGNADILAYPIYKDLSQSDVRPSRIIQRGFELGTTGSIGDLMRHFELDSNGIYALVKKF